MNIDDTKMKIEMDNMTLVMFDLDGGMAEWVSFVKIPGLDMMVMENLYIGTDTHHTYRGQNPHAYISLCAMSPFACLPSGELIDMPWAWGDGTGEYMDLLEPYYGGSPELNLENDVRPEVV